MMMRGVSFAGRRVFRSVRLASMGTLSSNPESAKANANTALYASAAAVGLSLMAVTNASCEDSHPHFTPSQVAVEAYPSADEHESEMQKHPVYTSDQVAENDGTNGKPVWMSYGGVVYDVTEFIANHPGGSEKVRMTSMSTKEPGNIKIVLIHSSSSPLKRFCKRLDPVLNLSGIHIDSILLLIFRRD